MIDEAIYTPLDAHAHWLRCVCQNSKFVMEIEVGENTRTIKVSKEFFEAWKKEFQKEE